MVKYFLRNRVFHTFKKGRYLSTVKPSEKGSYEHTVTIPATDFPNFFKNISERDIQVQKEAGFLELYEWQRKHMKGKEFVLHDGPPYANGNPHIGHAINKIFKDIVLRSQLIQGKRVHYIPGWDCHGLPIELRALGNDWEKLPPEEIRRKAREFAYKSSQDQMKAFKQWGVIGDWDKQCYYTYDNKYVSNELQIFWKLYEKGLIYNDLKPVYWSPSSRSALAESELVYNENHKSHALTVRFEVVSKLVPDNCYLLIWTTTPWTLPANQAVFYSSNIEYSIINIASQSGSYIVAKNLVPELEKKFNSEIKILSSVSIEQLKNIQYRHPWNKNKMLKLIESPYVSLMGTGLNHGAPAHGHEDFLLGLKYNLPVECVVDEKGCFTKEAGSDLEGLDVIGKGSKRVIELLNEDIVFREKYQHSYPYDWRTNKPVIIRASKQWFIDIESLKQSALESISKVSVPTNDIQIMVQSRPYWCLSRQRCWGVPIPAFFHKSSGRPLISKSLIDHLCKLFESSSPDIWWSAKTEELFPPKIRSELFVHIDDVIKGKDIMDIWFDSGVSWSYALNGKESDLCIEGLDQFGGWFQSSLLTSTAVLKKAPYKKLLAHGFAVDEKGKKMSKSLGNVIDPADVLPKFGVDTLRWWVATHANNKSVFVSNSLLKENSENVRKIRITLRFLLAALKNLSAEELENIKPTIYLDRFVLKSCYDFYKSIIGSYNVHNLGQVTTKILEFTAEDISSNYLSLIKDRLYCDKEESERRKSCLCTLNGIFQTLTHGIAPILPHLVEEINLFKGEGKFFYNSDVWNPPEWWNCEDGGEIQLAYDIRKEILTLFKSDSFKQAFEVSVDENDFELLKRLQNEESSVDSELAEVLHVTEVKLVKGERKITPVPHSYVKCIRCRQLKALQATGLCNRCEKFVNDLEKR